MTGDKDAFGILSNLSRMFSQGARDLPAQVDITPVRTLVCFRVLGQNLGILLEELTELLEVPHCTKLPRVKSWVRGVANVRGRLLPVIDFAEYLGGHLQSPPKQQRVLIIDVQGIFVGLQVDSVVGARHLKVDTYDASAKKLPGALERFVEGCFSQETDHWHLFRPQFLVNENDFLEVAV